MDLVRWTSLADRHRTHPVYWSVAMRSVATGSVTSLTSLVPKAFLSLSPSPWVTLATTSLIGFLLTTP